MAYTLRRLSRRLTPRDLALLEDLEQACFPDDSPYPNKVGTDLTWWLVWDARGKAVGFAGAKFRQSYNALFLCCAGVVPGARGNGLQRRLIRARLSHARREDARAAVTYTLIDNYISANNLIRCGFELWKPRRPWVEPKVLYWRRDI